MANRNDLARQFRRRRDRELATSLMHQMRRFRQEKARLAASPPATTPRTRVPNFFRRLAQLISRTQKGSKYDSANR